MEWVPSVTTRGHIWCFCRVNSARYIAHVINPVLLSFLRQEGDVLFSRTTHVHTQRALRGAQQLPWPARSPDVSWWQRVQDAWDNLSQDGIWHLHDRLHARTNACFSAKKRGVLCVLVWLFGHPLLWHMCFIRSEFVITYSNNDKLPVTSIFNTINLSLKVLHFFR